MRSDSFLKGGLINEAILDVPKDKRPEVINGRGRQMKATSIRQMFEDHHMPHLFARPRTPNDNPFVESLCGTVKTAPVYPGRFLDRDKGIAYFNRFFSWYDTEHLHSGIDHVTPEQCHRGLQEKIVSAKKANLNKQRLLRKEVNRLQQRPLTNDPIPLIGNQTTPKFCSVINS